MLQTKSPARQPYSYRDDPAVPAFNDDQPIIVFDGNCILCSRWAQFVMRHDPDKKFKLLAAQTPLGHALYQHYGLDPINYESNILITDGVAWLKAESTIRMLAELEFPWSLIRVFGVLPKGLMDWLYMCIADNRYRLFGKRDSCFVPGPDIKDRFLV